MIHIVAKNILKPGCKQAFLDAAGELVAKSQAEAGCISYDLFQDSGDESTVTFLEVWKDQEAIDRHNASEHFTRIVPRLGELCSGSEVALYHKIQL